MGGNIVASDMFDMFDMFDMILDTEEKQSTILYQTDQAHMSIHHQNTLQLSIHFHVINVSRFQYYSIYKD